MVTIGSQASGETGLKIWMSGVSPRFTVGDRPQRMPIGTAMIVAMAKPKSTVWIEVQIWA